MAFLFSSEKDRKKKKDLEELVSSINILNKQLLDVQERIDMIENVLAKRLPPDLLTERTFREEVQSSDEIIDILLTKVEEISKAKSVRSLLEERLDEVPTPVETRRIESITGLLQQHGKLSSLELSQHIGLSRTRCNEYFKQMEEMGVVEPVMEGREKFYRLS